MPLYVKFSAHKMKNKTILDLRILTRITMQLFLILVLAFSSEKLSAQEELRPGSKEKAIEYFKEGQYIDALGHYRALSLKFARDPLYKYYSGACLVELNQDIKDAIELLEESRKESSSLRTVPDKSLFYLARAYQIDGEFDIAIELYDRFRDLIRKKEAKEYKLDLLIEQCTIKVASNEIEGMSDTADVQYPVEEALEAESQPGIIEAGPEQTRDDYNSIARLGLEYQFSADSLRRVVSKYRTNLKSLSGADRASFNKLILDLESEIFQSQSMADRKFAEAASYNRVLYDGESADLRIENSRVEDDTIQDAKNEDEVSDIDLIDVIKIAEEVIPEPEPVYSIFGTEFKTPDMIPVNDTLPEGLYYRIQTAAFRNPIKATYFKTLGPVYGIKASGSEITYYFIGLFRRKTDADKAMVNVRSAGFKDAFVVAVFESKRISLERSTVLEKDWADISLFKTDPYVKVKNADKALTLVFRVEADRSEKQFKEENLETLKLVAGKRELSIKQNENEEYVCLIGKFLTFESAQTYADLLYRNGLKEARVAAYMGDREIPLKTARELFDHNYKK